MLLSSIKYLLRVGFCSDLEGNNSTMQGFKSWFSVIAFLEEAVADQVI